MCSIQEEVLVLMDRVFKYISDNSTLGTGLTFVNMYHTK